MKYLELAQILDLVSIFLLENKKKFEKSRRIRIFFPVNINLSLDAKQLLWLEERTPRDFNPSGLYP